MRRRHLLAAPIVLAASRASARRDDGRRTVGYLSGDPRPTRAALAAHPMVRALAVHGYDEDRNLAVAWRFAAGDFARLPALAQELLDLGAEVIVTPGGLPAAAAMHATSERPIVVAAAGPSPDSGAAAPARPIGNVTGLRDGPADIAGRRLDVLRRIAPEARRVAVLFHADDPATAGRARALLAAAEPRGFAIEPVGLHAVAAFDAARTATARLRPDALMLVSDPVTTINQRRIVALAREQRLPALYEHAEQAHAGGLAAYGPSLCDQQARAGRIVARLLDGMRPAALPIEPAPPCHLTVNLAAARAIGLKLLDMALAPTA